MQEKRHTYTVVKHTSPMKEGNDQKGSRNSCKVKYIPATTDGRTLAFEIDSAIYQQLAIITMKVEIKFRETHNRSVYCSSYSKLHLCFFDNTYVTPIYKGSSLLIQ